MKYKTDEIYEDFILKTEGVKMEFDGLCNDIFLLMKQPCKNFVENFKHTNPFFQIYTKNNIIFLLIKFEEVDWIDIPYIHEGKSFNGLKIEDENFGYPVNIYLFDILTGRLIAQRHSFFNHGLSKALYWAIQNQIKNPPKNTEEKVNSIRASFHPNEIARLSLGR